MTRTEPDGSDERAALATAERESEEPDPPVSARDDASPRRDTHLGWVLLALGATLLLRIVPTLDAARPVFFEDEIGYLTNAHLLSGTGSVELGAMGYYQPGWSLFLVPFYWLTQDPAVIYRASVLLAALCGWLLAFPVAALLKRVAGVPTRRALVIAALGCAVPSSVLMGGYAFGEQAISLVLAVWVLLGFLVTERPTLTRVVVLGATSGYLTLMHGRMLAIPILAVGFLITRAVTRRLRTRWAVVGTVVTAAASLAAYAVDEYVKATMYTLNFDRLSLGLASALEIDVQSFLVVAGGQAWYLAVTTGVLAFVGISVVGTAAFAEVRSRCAGPLGLWFLGVASIFSISFLNMVHTIPGPARLDYLSYGRLNEVFAPPLASLALALLISRRGGARARLLWSTATVGVVGLVVLVAAGGQEAFVGRPIAALNVTGMAWAITPGENSHPMIIVSVVAIAAALILVALSRHAVAVLVVWTILVSAAAIVGEYRTLRTLDAPWSTLLSMQGTLRSIDPAVVSFDTRASSLYARNGYQFYLPEAEFTFFDGTSRVPVHDVVISRHVWPAGEAAGARRVAVDPRLDEAVWVMPGDLQDDLRTDGWLMPRATNADLPRAAREVQADLVDREEVGERVVLDQLVTLGVELEHAGGGAPWRPTNAMAGDVTGTVRVVAWWQCQGGPMIPHITELPRVVMPGQSVTVDVPFDPAWMDGAASCDVSIDLIEEGVGMFSETAPIRLDVVAVDG